MEPKFISSTDINEIYGKLKSQVVHVDGTITQDITVVCIQNYDGSLPDEVPRRDEIESRLVDLLDEKQARYFRFNHGLFYFSKEIFPKDEGKEYISQFDYAIDLIKRDHLDKSIMQVILPNMMQARSGPIPAVISVMLRPRSKFIDIIACYREQEFSVWWPLNVKELSIIQDKAVAELSTLNYKKGDIITVTLQGYWNPSVRLGNKSAIDDDGEAKRLAGIQWGIFNFSSAMEGKKDNCQNIIDALTEKRKNTSISSFDSAGFNVLKNSIMAIKNMLETSTDPIVNSEKLEELKTRRNNIEVLLNRIIEEFDSFAGDQYNISKADGIEWKDGVIAIMDKLISEFEQLKEGL